MLYDLILNNDVQNSLNYQFKPNTCCNFELNLINNLIVI